MKTTELFGEEFSCQMKGEAPLQPKPAYVRLLSSFTPYSVVVFPICSSFRVMYPYSGLVQVDKQGGWVKWVSMITQEEGQENLQLEAEESGRSQYLWLVPDYIDALFDFSKAVSKKKFLSAGPEGPELHIWGVWHEAMWLLFFPSFPIRETDDEAKINSEFKFLYSSSILVLSC